MSSRRGARVRPRWRSQPCAGLACPASLAYAIGIERVRKNLDTSFPTANAAVKVLEDLSIVSEVTGQKKNCSYSYQPYIELLSRW